MTRTMGDATHLNVSALPRNLDIVAGYNTGSPDIVWTPADFAQFPNAVHVTIDQAFTGSPRYDSNVIDVETGAYDPSQVQNWMDNSTAARPTLYVNRGNETVSCLEALRSPRFGGDVWLAYPTWQPGQPLPTLPAGCQYVAIQNQVNVADAYDLSVVLDPDWPQKKKRNNDMLIIWGASGKAYLLAGGRLHHITDIAQLNLYTAAGVQVAGSSSNPVSAAEEAGLLADYPPGQPAVSVTVPPVSVTVPTFTLNGTVTPA